MIEICSYCKEDALVSTNPNQNQQPDNLYGGYGGGYTPSNPTDDPYGAAAQQGRTAAQQNDPNYVYGQQQQGSSYGQQQQQQQGTYVPPSSVTRNRAGSSSWSGQGTSAGPIDSRSRLRALLSYLGLCFTGIFFLFRDRKNRYVSYHAAQSIVVFAPLVVVYVVISILGGIIAVIPVIGLLSFIFLIVLGLLKFVIIALWLILMAVAYLGINVKVPYVSVYAEKLQTRFSR
jgi:uncharacterized membrane protein